MPIIIIDMNCKLLISFVFIIVFCSSCNLDFTSKSKSSYRELSSCELGEYCDIKYDVELEGKIILGDVPESDVHKIYPLISNKEAIKARYDVWHNNSASTFYFSTYEWHEDKVGLSQAKWAVERAREGKKVYVVVDSVGHSLSPELLLYMKENGVKVMVYRPARISKILKRNIKQLNYRMHDKILWNNASDTKSNEVLKTKYSNGEMILGGRNSTDAMYGLDNRGPDFLEIEHEAYVRSPSSHREAKRYINNLLGVRQDGKESIHLEELSKYVETFDVKERLNKELEHKAKMAKTSDGVVKNINGLLHKISRIFTRTKPIDYQKYIDMEKVLDKAENDLFKAAGMNKKRVDWLEKSITAEDVKFVHDFVGGRNVQFKKRVMNHLYDMLGRTEGRFIMNSQYGSPTPLALDAFEVATTRLYKNDKPIKLYFITNDTGSWEVGADRWIHDDFHLGIDKLKTKLGEGVNIFGFQGRGRIHSKVAVRDGKECLVWSANLDPRSQKINLEVGVRIISPAICKKYEDHIHYYMRRSHQYVKNGKMIAKVPCVGLFRRLVLKFGLRKQL